MRNKKVIILIRSWGFCPFPYSISFSIKSIIVLMSCTIAVARITIWILVGFLRLFFFLLIVKSPFVCYNWASS